MSIEMNAVNAAHDTSAFSKVWRMREVDAEKCLDPHLLYIRFQRNKDLLCQFLRQNSKKQQKILPQNLRKTIRLRP